MGVAGAVPLNGNCSLCGAVHGYILGHAGYAAVGRVITYAYAVDLAGSGIVANVPIPVFADAEYKGSAAPDSV